MMNEREAGMAAQLLALSRVLAGSQTVQARRAGERVEAILRDLLYEHDPWSDVLSGGKPSVASAATPTQRPPHPLPPPILTEENRGHWDAAKRHEFRLQRCQGCGMVRFPIAYSCPQCLSPEHEWALLSGRGRVSSWVVFHKAYWPSMSEQVPYIVAQIELEEGPRYTSNIVGLNGRDMRMDMQVEAVFDDVTGTLTLPKFRPTVG